MLKGISGDWPNGRWPKIKGGVVVIAENSGDTIKPAGRIGNCGKIKIRTTSWFL
jgi:lysophospholipid acyltransferase (LPLAT)-like uncharacterized protein